MCQLAPWSFRINLNDILSCNSVIAFLRPYVSPKYSLSFLSNVYIPPWLGKVLKLMTFILLKNAFMSHKLNINIFTHASHQTKLFPKFLLLSPREREIRLYPQAAIFRNSISSAGKGRGGNYISRFRKVSKE